MGTRDARIDAYIAKSAEFARPILEYLRETVHQYCPAVEETIKWGFPHFMYHGMFCSMAAFKQHCAFGFWKWPLLFGEASSAEAMGDFGRIASLKEAPGKKVLAGYIRQAMQLNESDTKPSAGKKKAPKPAAVVPDDLAAALKKNRKAAAAFEAFSPSNRREYIEWLTEAKREETRAKRLVQALEWIAEGKSRNWKYESC